MLLPKHHKDNGFTLVELSIVLVIIALLAASVTAGRSLIENAEIQKMANQFGEIESAIVTFQDRFKCTPGDCTTASRFNLGSNGDGDYTLDNAEPAYFWQHLSAAGLIQTNGLNYFQTGVPLIKGGVSTNSGVINGIPGLYLKLGEIGPTGQTFANNITPAYAMIIDKKLDDGLPRTCGGNQWRMVGIGASSNSLESSAASTAVGCVPDDAACCVIMAGACGRYSQLTTERRCGLMWRLGISMK